MIPATRADCIDGPRPCPHTTCVHHLVNEIRRWKRTDDQAETCTLDVADRGPQTLESLAQILCVTRERIRQIESDALTRIRLRRMGMFCRDTTDHYGVGLRKNLHVFGE